MMFPEELVKRTQPINYHMEDDALFAHEWEKKLGPVALVEFYDVSFYPNGMLLRNAEMMPLSASFQGKKASWKDLLRLLSYRVYCRKDRHLKSPKMPLVITDQFSNAYFHWVADCLPKLMALQSSLKEYLLILPAYMRKFSFVAESLLAWPELEVVYCNSNKNFFFNKLTVFPALASTGNYRPAIMQELGAHFRRWGGEAQESKGAGRPSKRIYISRSKALFRKIINEADVEVFLKNYGFEKVFLEDLTFVQQIKLLSETEMLVSNHGAGLTNMLFMPKQAKVLEIRLRGDHENNCYFSLASACQLQYFYCLADSATVNGNAHVAHLQVSLADLEKELKLFLES